MTSVTCPQRCCQKMSPHQTDACRLEKQNTCAFDKNTAISLSPLFNHKRVRTPRNLLQSRWNSVASRAVVKKIQELCSDSANRRPLDVKTRRPTKAMSP